MHVMIDLETMGTGNDSAIVSLGAVFFDEEGLHEEFYLTIDLDSCLEKGLTVSGSTIRWWMDQSEKAREEIIHPGFSLVGSLKRFSKFMAEHDGKIEGVWGNGATFDNVILANAYKACDLKVPWGFWLDRCYRTLRNVVDLKRYEPEIAHHALYDAISQAKSASEALKEPGVL